MAPIIQSGHQLKENYSLLNAWVAAFSLLVTIIIALLGIKLWWFKHRLSFEQKPTPNFVTGKDKRQSQEVSHSIATHGVFRKRNEDELETPERQRQFPPVRIQARSISSTALIPPPRTERMNLRPPEVTVSMLPDASSLQELDSITKPTLVEEQDHHHQNVLESPKNARVEYSSFEFDGTVEKGESKVNIERAEEIIATAKQNMDTNLFPGSAEMKSNEQPIVNVAELKNGRLESNVQSDPVELLYKDLETVESFNEEDNFGAELPWNMCELETTNIVVNHSSIAEDMIPHLSETPLYQQEIDKIYNQEFEKIRYSFQQQEGHFLELNESFNEVPHSPTGYGKNIDEDWENFEDLIKTPTVDRGNSKNVETKLKTHFDQSCNTSSQITFVQNFEELYNELTDSDDDITTRQSSLSILKAPQFISTRSDYTSPFGNIQESKAQQKVTFDVHTEEYYLTESDSDSAVEAAENAIPTPMKRTAKIQYNFEHIKNDQEASSTMIRYSTEIFLDTPIEERDTYTSNGSPRALHPLTLKPAPRLKRSPITEA